MVARAAPRRRTYNNCGAVLGLVESFEGSDPVIVASCGPIGAITCRSMLETIRNKRVVVSYGPSHRMNRTSLRKQTLVYPIT